MIRKMIRWWKADTNPDHAFCDDHEWVGLISKNEECPECKRLDDSWEKYMNGANKERDCPVCNLSGVGGDHHKRCPNFHDY